MHARLDHRLPAPGGDQAPLDGVEDLGIGQAERRDRRTAQIVDLDCHSVPLLEICVALVFTVGKLDVLARRRPDRRGDIGPVLADLLQAGRPLAAPLPAKADPSLVVHPGRALGFLASPVALSTESVRWRH